MGLDMWAQRTSPGNLTDPDAQVDLAFKDSDAAVELSYWRKHHDLHGWMHQLYQCKGGASEQFNLNTVRLTLEDLAELEKAVVNNKLPATYGFFFGDNPPDEESQKHDLEFIAAAREAIANGDVVFYDSWW